MTETDVAAACPGCVRRERLHLAVLIVVWATAVLRAVLILLSVFTVWPIGGVATFALANTPGWAVAGLGIEVLLVALAIWAAVRIMAGLRTPERRSYRRAGLLGWVIIGGTVYYLASIVVGLWSVDGWFLVAENWTSELLALALHIPVLWLSARVIRQARALAAHPEAPCTEAQ